MQHRRGQVFPVPDGREDDAQDVQCDEPEEDVRKRLVKFLDPVHALESVRRVEPARPADQRHHRQKHDDHPAAERVVADEARFLR